MKTGPAYDSFAVYSPAHACAARDAADPEANEAVSWGSHVGCFYACCGDNHDGSGSIGGLDMFPNGAGLGLLEGNDNGSGEGHGDFQQWEDFHGEAAVMKDVK